MRVLIIAFRLFALIAVLAAAACDQQTSTSAGEEADGLVGVWRVVSINDKQLSDHGFEIIWTISSDEIAVSDGSDDSGDEISRSPYRTDPTQSPKHITMFIRDIAEEDRVGIYAVEGDQLRVSFAVNGASRPDHFADSEDMLLERIR